MNINAITIFVFSTFTMLITNFLLHLNLQQTYSNHWILFPCFNELRNWNSLIDILTNYFMYSNVFIFAKLRAISYRLAIAYRIKLFNYLFAVWTQFLFRRFEKITVIDYWIISLPMSLKYQTYSQIIINDLHHMFGLRFWLSKI